MGYLIGKKPAPSEKDEQVIPETWIDNLTWLEHQMQSNQFLERTQNQLKFKTLFRTELGICIALR